MHESNPNPFEGPYQNGNFGDRGRGRPSYYGSRRGNYDRFNERYSSTNTDSRNKKAESNIAKLEKQSKSKVMVPERYGVPKQVVGFWKDTPKAQDDATESEKSLMTKLIKAENNKIHRVGYNPSKFLTQFDLENKKNYPPNNIPQGYSDNSYDTQRARYPNRYQLSPYDEWKEAEWMRSHGYQSQPRYDDGLYRDDPYKNPLGDDLNKNVPESVKNKEFSDVSQGINEMKPESKTHDLPSQHHSDSSFSNVGNSDVIEEKSAQIPAQIPPQSESGKGSTNISTEVNEKPIAEIPLPPKSMAWILRHKAMLSTKPPVKYIAAETSSAIRPTTTTTEGIPMPPKSNMWIRKQQLLKEEKALHQEFEQVADQLVEAVNRSSNSFDINNASNEVKGELEEAEEIIQQEENVKEQKDVVNYVAGLEEGKEVTLPPAENNEPSWNIIAERHSLNGQNISGQNIIILDSKGKDMFDVKEGVAHDQEKRERNLEEERTQPLERDEIEISNQGASQYGDGQNVIPSSDFGGSDETSRQMALERERAALLSPQQVGQHEGDTNSKVANISFVRPIAMENGQNDGYNIENNGQSSPDLQNPVESDDKENSQEIYSVDHFPMEKKKATSFPTSSKASNDGGPDLEPRDSATNEQEDDMVDDDLQKFARIWMESNKQNHRRKRQASDVNLNIGQDIDTDVRSNDKIGNAVQNSGYIGKHNEGVVNGKVVSLPAKAGNAKVHSRIYKQHKVSPLKEVETQRIGVPKKVAGFWRDTQNIGKDSYKSGTREGAQEDTRQLLAKRKLFQLSDSASDAVNSPSGKNPLQKAIKIALKKSNSLPSHSIFDEGVRSARFPVPSPSHQRENMPESSNVGDIFPSNLPEKMHISPDTDVKDSEELRKSIFHKRNEDKSQDLNETKVSADVPSKEDPDLRQRTSVNHDTEVGATKQVPKYIPPKKFKSVHDERYKEEMLRDQALLQNPRVKFDGKYPVPLSGDSSSDGHKYHEKVDSLVRVGAQVEDNNATAANGTDSDSGFQIFSPHYYKNLMRRYR